MFVCPVPMTFSDYLVLDAIRVLSQQPQLITYADIAAQLPTPCSTRTVLRSVQRLERLGHVTRYNGGRGEGYMYNVLEALPDAV